MRAWSLTQGGGHGCRLSGPPEHARPLWTEASDHRSLRRSCGFTLLEVSVAMAIAAILFALAVPSYSLLVKSSVMSSTVNGFLADMRFARSEGIRRGGSVVMCRSDAPEAASPTCGTAAGPTSIGWASGWIVFQNLDPGASGGNRAQGDPVLRIQGPIQSVNSIAETGATTSTEFRFTGTGRLLGLGAPVTLAFGASPAWATDAQRTVCVGFGGYARLAGDGTVAC